MKTKQEAPSAIISVKVTPGASRTELSHGPGGLLLARLTSPPVEGKANRELVKLLSKKLRVPASSVSIIRGQSSREKTVAIEGLDKSTVMERLGFSEAPPAPAP